MKKQDIYDGSKINITRSYMIEMFYRLIGMDLEPVIKLNDIDYTYDFNTDEIILKRVYEKAKRKYLILTSFVDVIDSYAIQDTNRIVSIDASSVKRLNYNAISGNSIKELFIPSCVEIYYNLFMVCKPLHKYIYNPNLYINYGGFGCVTKHRVLNFNNLTIENLSLYNIDIIVNNLYITDNSKYISLFPNSSIKINNLYNYNTNKFLSRNIYSKSTNDKGLYIGVDDLYGI